MEKKWLMVSVVALVAGLCIGAVLGLAFGSKYREELKRENEVLKGAWEALDAEHELLVIEYNFLNETYETTLDTMQHMFTYYAEGNAISISNVGIYERWLGSKLVNGTLTNISDEPIETVYIFCILRNPDGTADFDPYHYDRIDSLYIDESEEFAFEVYIDEGQTVEFLMIY